MSPSIGSQQQTRCFRFNCCCGSGWQEILIDCCMAGAHQQRAASKCGQCHVVSVRRYLNRDEGASRSRPTVAPFRLKVANGLVFLCHPADRKSTQLSWLNRSWLSRYYLFIACWSKLFSPRVVAKALKRYPSIQVSQL